MMYRTGVRFGRAVQLSGLVKMKREIDQGDAHRMSYWEGSESDAGLGITSSMESRTIGLTATVNQWPEEGGNTSSSAAQNPKVAIPNGHLGRLQTALSNHVLTELTDNDGCRR
jgi:hypothetical protein